MTRLWFTVPVVSASPTYLRSVPDTPAPAPGRRAPVGSAGPRRVVDRACARPGCAASPLATLRFAYADREAWLEALATRVEPGAYDLCGPHAERTRPPHGWALFDRRPRDPQPAAGTPTIDPGSAAAPAGTGPAIPGPEAVSEDRPAPVAATGVDRGAAVAGAAVAEPGGIDEAPAAPAALAAPAAPAEHVSHAGPLVTRATRSSSVPAPRVLIPRPEAEDGAQHGAEHGAPSDRAAVDRPPVWNAARSAAPAAPPAAPAAVPAVAPAVTSAGARAAAEPVPVAPAAAAEPVGGPDGPRAEVATTPAEAETVLDAANGSARPLPLGGITW
jgi:hypothetical protein